MRSTTIYCEYLGPVTLAETVDKLEVCNKYVPVFFLEIEKSNPTFYREG